MIRNGARCCLIITGQDSPLMLGPRSVAATHVSEGPYCFVRIGPKPDTGAGLRVEMPSRRRWLWLTLLLPLTVGLFEAGRLPFYSLAPVPEDRLKWALQVLAYRRISCAHAYLSDYSEGSIALQCRDREATQYTVFGQEPCSETLGCRWFSVLCWNTAKNRPRAGAPIKCPVFDCPRHD